MKMVNFKPGDYSERLCFSVSDKGILGLKEKKRVALFAKSNQYILCITVPKFAISQSEV